MSSFFCIFAGTPLFVASGNPHRCGAFEQLAGVGVGFGVVFADGEALGVPLNVGTGDGATDGCLAPWRVIRSVPPTTSPAMAATAARDTPTLAARLIPSPPIRCRDIAGPLRLFSIYLSAAFSVPTTRCCCSGVISAKIGRLSS